MLSQRQGAHLPSPPSSREQCIKIKQCVAPVHSFLALAPHRGQKIAERCQGEGAHRLQRLDQALEVVGVGLVDGADVLDVDELLPVPGQVLGAQVVLVALQPAGVPPTNVLRAILAR